MAARLPINPLPFETDETVSTFYPPRGEEFVGTKRAYFDSLMAAWYPASNEAKAAVAFERELRAEINKLIYPDGFSTEGTDKFELPSGWVLEFKRTINVKVDATQLPALKAAIEALEVDPDSGEMPSFDACIAYKPDFSMSGYKTLRDDVRVLLDEALEMKPGTPAVELVPPKQKATQKASDQKAVAK